MKIELITVLIVGIQLIECGKKSLWERLNLPEAHMPYFFSSNEKLRLKCVKDDTCPYREQANESALKCWGYEKGCKAERSTFLPQCPGDSNGWTKDKQEQIDLFWKQGDFGYIKERLGEMRYYCKSDDVAQGGAMLECVDHLRMCRARNVYFDFKDLRSAASNDRYREDIFKPGQVGGKCKLNSGMLKANGDHKSPLQSWYSELQLFEEHDESPLTSGKCDIIVSEPTFLIKLDAGVNMYHHFCDFVNLYATQHANNSFFQNVNIVLWDTSGSDYWSFFTSMWSVFSSKKPTHLKEYDGKKVRITL